MTPGYVVAGQGGLRKGAGRHRQRRRRCGDAGRGCRRDQRRHRKQQRLRPQITRLSPGRFELTSPAPPGGGAHLPWFLRPNTGQPYARDHPWPQSAPPSVVEPRRLADGRPGYRADRCSSSSCRSLFAFGLTFTNQRLVSPNPTEFVGLRKLRSLLGVGLLTLEPERDDAGRSSATLDEDGRADLSRACARYTRNNPDYPQYRGMREWFSFQWGDSQGYVLARDVVFMKALVNTLVFVLVVAPVQGGLALVLALLINQKLRGINVFRTIYFMPVVVSIVVVSLLWRFIYDGQNGLLNNLLSG